MQLRIRRAAGNEVEGKEWYRFCTKVSVEEAGRRKDTKDGTKRVRMGDAGTGTKKG
jgi:hypothetical protein